MSEELPVVRASDTEREQTAELLRHGMTTGRLTLEEFTQRVEAAYAARTREELEEVTRDLPADAPATTRPAKHLTAVAFGNVQRKGRWRVPRRAAAVGFFGDVDVDLRTAEIDHSVVTITAYLLFGNVDFYVPEGVDVDVGGLTIFGHRREHGDELTPRPGTPLIRIRVYALVGTSDVWRIPHGVTGSFRELIRSTRRRELGSGSDE